MKGSRYRRIVLRRLALIRAARHVGLSLDDVREALGRLPESRTPTREDWARRSTSWRHRLDAEIDALVALRDRLTSCTGCGSLSLKKCRISNPNDMAARSGPGAVLLLSRLREPRPEVKVWDAESRPRSAPSLRPPLERREGSAGLNHSAWCWPGWRTLLLCIV